MLLFVIFIQYIKFASAVHEFFADSLFPESDTPEDSDHVPRCRFTRDTTNEKIAPDTPSCDHMELTQNSPFIVLMLYKTSGRFLGMGSIIDRETILTSVAVVKKAMENPPELIALAGRLNPWWGDNSQVSYSKNIYAHDFGLALVRLQDPLMFNRYVKAIRLLEKTPGDYASEYTPHWGIFGIPRGTWNVPGDLSERTCIYVMKVETEPTKQEDKKKCGAAYPDLDFNETIYTCTIANFTFGWGCQGSPTLAVDKRNKLQQIGVITDAARSNNEHYHIHLKLGLVLRWIKAHSHLGFIEEDEDKY